MVKDKVTVIIPLHEVTKESVSLLEKAIESIPEGVKTVVSVKKGTQKKSLPQGVGVISDSESTCFQELVNTAVAKVDTEWFSILEYDDTYTSIWEKNADEHMKELPDVSVFMFLQDMTDFNTEKYVAIGNEAAWASAFSDEIGYLDNESLQSFFDFYPSGAIFNVSDWNAVGGLKPLIKATHWYEWMLRATRKGKKIYVIPKVGYNHTVHREDSLSEIFSKEMSEKEIEWWFDIAKRDYFFDEEKDADYYTFKDNGEESVD